MNQFTKMKMVPYDPLRNQEPDAPLLHQLSNLDQQLLTIVNDHTLPPELKHQKYMQTFQRYQSLKAQQLPEPLQTEPTKPKLDTEEMLDAIPKQYKPKTRLLIQHVNKHPDIFNWTPDGQLKYEGMPIRGSNMLDLVYDFSRKRGPFSEPAIGSQQFATLLKETNAPNVAIGNPERMKDPLLSSSRFAALLDNVSDIDEPRTPERLDQSGTPIGIPKTPMTGSRSARKKKKKEQKKAFDDDLAAVFDPVDTRYPKRERKPVKHYDPVKGHGYADERINGWDMYY